MSKNIAYRFSRSQHDEFAKTLKKRVYEYFKENGINRYANSSMVFKTLFMLTLYFLPYGLLLSGLITNMWIVWGLWILMSFGMSGIGLSIMHDANHGSYSRNKKVNTLLSYLINFVGGNKANWRLQHNVLHHTYTNIEGADDDIAGPPFLRFSPHQKKRKIHKYQHLYAWFFYGLMTLSWSTSKDFFQLKKFKDMGLTKSDQEYRKIMWGLAFWKLFYFAYALALPIIFTPVAWWVTLIGFFVMHMICGFLLAIIFQSAHVLSNSEFPLPKNEKKEIENHWLVHQLLNTTNFAPKNKILTWYAGGLNYQIEHHLFPDICHIHYHKIAEIVKSTAKQFDLPYYSIPSFRSAVYEHAKMLWLLGNGKFAPAS